MDELIKPASEKLIVLNDLSIDNNQIVLAQYMITLMSGREGNHVFANGTIRPILDVVSGETHRLRLLNASTARFYTLRFPGQEVTKIGTDGHLLEAPRAVSDILLVPGERVDLMVKFSGDSGASFDILSVPFERGHGATGGEFPVFTARFGEGQSRESQHLPGTIRAFSEPPSSVKTVQIELSEDPMEGGHGGHGGRGGAGPTFRINGEAHPDITPLEAVLGTTEDWVIFNNSKMDHPFHLHGFFFEVIESDQRSIEYRAKHDTVNVIAGETLKIRIHFDGFPGEWMFHCHILEHEERGMMGQISVK